ncbi:tetratricopeptide repeat protein [Borreliella burgdorferi]|uniref:tetratricopeptide repeat protein n=1 Tax=Borreliella burgdorferi TaxID=139 RepID=UPI000D026ECF|nr:tetratricopeptide repeat protein [Borreliella burgdorferi]PRQ93987.1 cell surface protein [Borreliella burgdorferi]PRR08783.1 cell surface protein [Borreliella burgdorferi]PRR26237.1 cell surface protein [Borreliella burgdorferi]PRR44174.1 cell surface protein [Borreliella burgdorferi]PRR46014.1 cell surface protein [Borreliella burgdorferi]
MNKKHTNFSVLLLLIFLLILSFGGFGYYIYQSKLNDKNREIMLNEVKNSVIDRNYKKAYSVAKLLQDKYPQNEDIAMLTNTLAEIANSSPFESKDLQRDSANQILDKIKGQDNTKTNVNENFDIAFNNRYIKDSTITENYSDRNDDVGIEDEDISEFKKSKIPEKIKPNTSPKEEDQIIQSPNPKLSVNDQKNLFNLEKLKKNLSGKSNSENILNNSQKIENDKQNTNLSKEKNSENILKTPDNSKYSNNNNTTSLKKIPSNSQKESELSPPSQTIIGKIYRPYSYLIKKELYEILDDINTGRVTLGKNRLKELIKKGLSNKFQKVNELIENSKNKEASNLLLTLIKKDIEPNLINIPKDPYKKEIFQLDKGDKKPQHPGDLKSKVHSIKPIDLENTKSRQQAIKDLNEFLKNNPNDAQASKTLAQANKIQHLEDLKSKVHSIKPIDLENTKSRQQAIKDLNEFLKNNPNDAQASKTLAQANKIQHLEDLKSKVYSIRPIDLENTKSRQQAIKDLNEFLKNNPNDAQASKTLAQANKIQHLEDLKSKVYSIRPIDLENTKSRQQAIKDLNEFLKNNPNDAQASKTLAQAYENNGDLLKAENAYEKIIKLTNTQEDHYKLGIIRFKLKKYEHSIESFDQTIKLDPKHKKALHNKGIALMMLNKNKKAIESFEKAIQIDKNYGTAYYQKGIAEEKNGDMQQAFASFKNAYNLDKNPNYALKAGIVSNNLGNFKQSEEYLNFFNANAKKPNEIAIYNLSIAKFENNKLEESLETINKAIDLNPEKSEYLYLKASINLKKENYQNAISLYSLVIEKNPENTSAYINLAKAYEKSGNKSQAISTLEKIINKNNKLALNNLGILYKKEKNYQKAIEIFEKAIINSDIEAKYNLATTLIEINDNTRAKDLLREYTKLKPNNPEALHALGIIEYNENNNDQTLRELIKKFPNYKKNENIKKIIGI